MQKNIRQPEIYARGYFRNMKSNLIGGIIIASVIAIIRLLSACDPVFPEKTEETRALAPKDSTQNEEITQDTDINDWDNDTTSYNTTAKPTKTNKFLIK